MSKNEIEGRTPPLLRSRWFRFHVLQKRHCFFRILFWCDLLTNFNEQIFRDGATALFFQPVQYGRARKMSKQPRGLIDDSLKHGLVM